MFVSYVVNQRAWVTKEMVPFVFKGHDKAIYTIRCKHSDDTTRIFTGSRDKKIKVLVLNYWFFDAQDMGFEENQKCPYN